jgi:hypothetical protein
VSPPPTCAACPRALETFFSQNRFRPGALLQRAASCRRWIRFTSVSLLGGVCFFLLFQERASSRRSEQSAQEPLGLVILRGEVVFLGGGETRALSSCPISRGFSLVLLQEGKTRRGREMAEVKPEEISHPPMEQLQGFEYCIDSNPPWGAYPSLDGAETSSHPRWNSSL